MFSTPFMLGDATTAAPRTDGWWQERHTAMNARVEKGSVDLVFIGDSITQGWEGAGKASWDKHFAPQNAVNLGIGGDQTQHVLWRLANGNLAGITPKVAVLMIGTNNTGNGQKPAEVAAGIKAILDELKKLSPTTKILLLAVFPRGETREDAMRLNNDAVNGLIKPFGDGTQVVFLDIGSKFLAADGSLSREIMPDSLHLSPAAYEIWAAEVSSTIATLMAPSTVQ